MGLSCGIVGLPNVGKSTLFNAITASQIPAENYPFCTIDPHVGIVSVPDPRLQALEQIVKPQTVLPTVLTLVDIAGLVAGAAQGEGLGNQFLAHIRETDAILHVVRTFENSDILHVDNRVDPVADAQVIQTELILADLQLAENLLKRLGKKHKAGDKMAHMEQSVLQTAIACLEQSRSLRTLCSAALDPAEKKLLQQYPFITLKPVLYIANVAELPSKEDAAHLLRFQEFAAQEQAEVIEVCAHLEAEIAQLDADEQGDFLRDLGWEEPGLHRLIRAAYRLLQLQTYFTAGPKEVRAWTIPAGVTAPVAAAAIHSDFQKGFIRAEVIHFADFVQHAGEQGAKEAGKWRLEGKEYIVQDGDVMHFRFNV